MNTDDYYVQVMFDLMFSDDITAELALSTLRTNRDAEPPNAEVEFLGDGYSFF